MNFAQAFCDSMEWHHRKWWGFNVPQSRWSFNAQVNLSGALICATTGNLFLQLIRVIFLLAAIWCCCRVHALRTRKNSAAGRTGPATPSRHAPRAVASAPAADTPRRKS